jgi:ribonuclease D
MNIITTTEALKGFCAMLSKGEYMCVDTEFMRDSSFWSKLCLIQASGPNCEAIIDPLADGLDMQVFLDLMVNPGIIKVMHAARQDMEIFFALCGEAPAPLFDSQIAAMALGYGDSVGYMALVKGRLGLNLDKGARFTDWSRRPLSNKQLHYALGDVTHLRDMYAGMVEELSQKGRLKWVTEEMETMLNPDLYTYLPENAWKRLKIRSPKQDYLAALKCVAAWRETEAQSRNVPRNRIIKDDGIYDIAQNRPATVEALGNLRGVPRGFEKSRSADKLLRALKEAVANKESYAPVVPKPKRMPPNLGPTIDMLKTLLRLRCEYNDIAPRLVANAADIEQLAAFGPKADVAALKGWRLEAYGDDALAMLRGEIGLRLEGREVVAQAL